MRGKGILVFNVFVLIGQVGALIGLADPVYRNSYITYLCMFVFVLAYLVLTLQEKYYKNFKHRELILVIFLTYMALIVKTNIPVINSILIMLIALGTHIIRLEQVKEAAEFLIEIMPVMFIPAGVGLLTAWGILKPVCVPIILITVITTVVVMIVTGRVTQAVIRMDRKKGQKRS